MFQTLYVSNTCFHPRNGEHHSLPSRTRSSTGACGARAAVGRRRPSTACRMGQEAGVMHGNSSSGNKYSEREKTVEGTNHRIKLGSSQKKKGKKKDKIRLIGAERKREYGTGGGEARKSATFDTFLSSTYIYYSKPPLFFFLRNPAFFFMDKAMDPPSCFSILSPSRRRAPSGSPPCSKLPYPGPQVRGRGGKRNRK